MTYLARAGLSPAGIIDLTRPHTPLVRNAFYFVSSYASAPIPTKQRPYAFWRLPALAFVLHGWQPLCLLGTSQMTATFQFSGVGLAKPSSQVAFLSNQLKSPDN
nr:hypothetical protein [Rhodospirillales bacterium]